MKKIRVCASYTYYYTIEVPNKLLNKENDLLDYCAEEDLTHLDVGVAYANEQLESTDWKINSIYENENCLYIG